MSLNRKLSLMFFAMVSGLLVLVIAVIMIAFRSFSADAATLRVQTAAEMLRVHLTEAMIQGTIHERGRFIDRLSDIDGLMQARVIRAPQVNAQFGDSTLDEAPADDIDRLVLADGRSRFVLHDRLGLQASFRGTIPYVATAQGEPNCLSCHMVPEGTVLGAVTLEVSIDDMKRRALMTVAVVALVLIGFAALALMLLTRLLRPVGHTARAVEQAVTSAMNGDFKTRLQTHNGDDIGKIAGQLNRLLAFLDDGLGRINARVEQLTERQPLAGENQLDVTVELVNQLADAASFKQAIEEDEHKSEVYDRFGRVLSERLGVAHYSIYEAVSASEMRTAVVDGVPLSPCKWCDPSILERPEHCRARRTGHVVDGFTQPDICYAFKAPGDSGRRYRHYCVPIMLQGEVGSVVQVVADEMNVGQIEPRLPYVKVFVREMAPVLEAKRLTETLRESALRDPMTGLNNRRFLEECIDSLVASARRRSTSLGLLMLDLDYFKVVNDTHGHDAGDTVLKALANTLRNAVRASDLVVRFGGEEFVIVLQDTDADGAASVAENIRVAVEALKINIGSEALRKTISIGYAMLPEDGDTFWQVIKFADVALYKAKADGRNRVVRFTPELWDASNGGY